MQFQPSTQTSHKRPRRAQSSALLFIPPRPALFNSNLPSLPICGVSHDLTPVSRTGVRWQRVWSRAQKHCCPFLWSFDWQPFWGLLLWSVLLSLPGAGLDKDTCVLTHHPSSLFAHTLSCCSPACFIRFDTPHQPAIVRARKGRMGLFVGIGTAVFVPECGS